MTQQRTRKHAKHSPSQLANLEICPGWKPQTGKKPHPVTESGTRCHEAFEHPELIDDLDDHEHESVQWCLAYVASVIPDRTDWEFQHEIKLETHEPTCYGYGDLLAVNGETAHYFDPKFGWNKQAGAEINPQGQAYVVGTFRKYPSVDRVWVHFLYPNKGTISRHEYTRKDDLAMLELRISAIIAEAKSRKAERRFDQSNCLYCGNKVGCPVLAEEALVIRNAVVSAQGNTPLTVFDPHYIEAPDMMARALELASILAEWAQDVRNAATAFRVEKGIEIPGYDLKFRRGRQSVERPEDVIREARSYGVTQEELDAACDIRLTAVCDAIKSHAPRGEKGKSVDAFKSQLLLSGAIREGQESAYLQRVKDDA